MNNGNEPNKFSRSHTTVNKLKNAVALREKRRREAYIAFHDYNSKLVALAYIGAALLLCITLLVACMYYFDFPLVEVVIALAYALVLLPVCSTYYFFQVLMLQYRYWFN